MRRTRIIKQFFKKSHFLLSFLMFVLIYNIRFNNYSGISNFDFEFIFFYIIAMNKNLVSCLLVLIYLPTYHIDDIFFSSFSETEIKLLDYTNDEIPLTAYDFDSTKKILFFTSFYEWKNFTFGLGNLPFVEVCILNYFFFQLFVYAWYYLSIIFFFAE